MRAQVQIALFSQANPFQPQFNPFPVPWSVANGLTLVPARATLIPSAFRGIGSDFPPRTVCPAAPLRCPLAAEDLRCGDSADDA